MTTELKHLVLNFDFKPEYNSPVIKIRIVSHSGEITIDGDKFLEVKKRLLNEQNVKENIMELINE